MATTTSERTSLLQRAVRRVGVDKVTEALGPDQLAAIAYVWQAVARQSQLPPPTAWRVWLILTGRGWGKTRTGAEWVRWKVATGQAGRIALVAPTASDARDIMVEGQAGILAVCPGGERPIYEPSKRRLSWSSGANATIYTADEPDRLRGPQHDAAWCDEIASWRYARESWNNLRFGLRQGTPQTVVTTTPRPIWIVKELIKRSNKPDAGIVITRGSTFENEANLSREFFDEIVEFEGTRIGRQEIEGEVLEDLENALWTHERIDRDRVGTKANGLPGVPNLVRVVVAVDPAVTSKASSSETGIVVAGVGDDRHGYALEDLSCRLSPDGWARRAVEAFHRWKADRIVGEVNQGGDLVERLIHTVDATVPFKSVRATRGKSVRAEPIAALAEQGKIHHVGSFPRLEDQCCEMAPQGYFGDGSPDRVDAMVWAFTELLLVGGRQVNHDLSGMVGGMQHTDGLTL